MELKNTAVSDLSASQQCKREGLDSLEKLSKMSGVSRQTLNNWHKNAKKAALWELLLLGAKVKKQQNEGKLSIKLK